MAKLATDPIGETDLTEFLDNESDFAFELRVVKMLRDMGIDCEHGGSYEDPATKKPREFDIRARVPTGQISTVRFAIECKNVRPNYPLVVATAPRHRNEAFHEMLMPTTRGQSQVGNAVMVTSLERGRSAGISGPHSLYAEGVPVGKSCAQVGRVDTKDRKLSGSDDGLFSRWAQALGSAQDLFLESLEASSGDEQRAASVLLPVVVVPNDMLWVAEYDHDGNRTVDPERRTRCSFFVGHTLAAGAPGWEEYRISHVGFVTQSGLASLVGNGTPDSALDVIQSIEQRS